MPKNLRITVLHGPNLNMLGVREPEIYGTTTLDEINDRLEKAAAENNVSLETFQSNSEGELVTRIQEAYGNQSGLLLNAGAYTHTSIAIRDAVASVGIPMVEVHLTNLHRREAFRRKSLLAGVAVGRVEGFGSESYLLGFQGLIALLRQRTH